MKIHEYQAKELFRKYSVPVPEGSVCETVAEVVQLAGTMGFPVAVKAQIHAGGRGKGGGVKVAKSAKEAESYVQDETKRWGDIIRRINNP